MHFGDPNFIDLESNTDLAASVRLVAVRVDRKSMGSTQVVWVMDISDQLEAVFHLAFPLVKLAGLGFHLGQRYSLNPIVVDCIWRLDQYNSELVVAAVQREYFFFRRLEVVCSHQFPTFLPWDLARNTTGFEQGDGHRFGGDHLGTDSDMSSRLTYLWLNIN